MWQLIFIACTFDFMRLALVPEKSNTSLIFPRSSSLFFDGLFPQSRYMAGKAGKELKPCLDSVKCIDKSQLEPTKLCLRDMGNNPFPDLKNSGNLSRAILMLREMESVLNQDSLLPAIAISLITLFYGIILYMLCLVSKSRIERRLVEKELQVFG